MSEPTKCRCGNEWFISTPDYGGGTEYAHYCGRAGSRVTHHEPGGKYIGGGRWEGMPELPDGYYAARRAAVHADNDATHPIDCQCACHSPEWYSRRSEARQTEGA